MRFLVSETDTRRDRRQMSGCQGLGEQDEECVFNVDAVSFWGDGNVLELDRGDGYTTQ